MARNLLLALLMAGCSFTAPASPDCTSPAPLLEFEPRGPGYIVSLRDGFRFESEVSRLADVYGFVPGFMDAELRSFFSEQIGDEEVPSLRCEETVAAVEENGISSPNATAR